MAKYVDHLDPAAVAKAHALARGCYQHNLIDGIESLSGATLRGKAKYWGAKYHVSRQHLLARLRAADIPISERIAEHGRRVLVIG